MSVPDLIHCKIVELCEYRINHTLRDTIYLAHTINSIQKTVEWRQVSRVFGLRVFKILKRTT